MDTLSILYNTSKNYPLLETSDATPDELVLSHLRLVNSIAKKSQWHSIPLEDLIQAGNVGLIRAAAKYDKSQGISFATYATYYIRFEIYEYLIKNISIVKSATTKARRKIFFSIRSYKRMLLHTLGQTGMFTETQVKEYAASLGVSEFDVREMEMTLSSDVPMFSSDPDSEDEFESPYLIDNSKDPVNQIQDAFREHTLNTSLPNAIENLDARTNDIIVSRYCSDTPSTLWDLAAKYNVSAERIRQIEVAGMKKLRKQLEPA